jgi:hypothetical protein
MPDASAGIFTGLYWVATGKTPMDEIQDDSGDDDEPQDEPGDDVQPPRQGWGPGQGWSRTPTGW